MKARSSHHAEEDVGDETGRLDACRSERDAHEPPELGHERLREAEVRADGHRRPDVDHHRNHLPSGRAISLSCGNLATNSSTHSLRKWICLQVTVQI